MNKTKNVNNARNNGALIVLYYDWYELLHAIYSNILT